MNYNNTILLVVCKFVKHVGLLGYESTRMRDMGGDEIRIVLGKNLKLFRGRKAMSQAALAENAGISIPFLSDIERGNKWPYMETLVKLAHALNIEPYELLKPEDMPIDINKTIIMKCLDDVLTASKQSFEEAVTKSIEKIRNSYI
jgi:transcriptional regulator with XRE-family HTH domain